MTADIRHPFVPPVSGGSAQGLPFAIPSLRNDAVFLPDAVNATQRYGAPSTCLADGWVN